MSTTTTWFLVKVKHQNLFDPDDILRMIGCALADSSDLEDAANEWLPGLQKVATYRSNGDERIAWDERLGPLVLARAGYGPPDEAPAVEKQPDPPAEPPEQEQAKRLNMPSAEMPFNGFRDRSTGLIILVYQWWPGKSILGKVVDQDTFPPGSWLFQACYGMDFAKTFQWCADAHFRDRYEPVHPDRKKLQDFADFGNHRGKPVSIFRYEETHIALVQRIRDGTIVAVGGVFYVADPETPAYAAPVAGKIK